MGVQAGEARLMNTIACRRHAMTNVVKWATGQTMVLYEHQMCVLCGRWEQL